jgi:hypothetical protein
VERTILPGRTLHPTGRRLSPPQERPERQRSVQGWAAAEETSQLYLHLFLISRSYSVDTRFSLSESCMSRKEGMMMRRRRR